ncbi:hypothetical protein [Moorena sp. SIOASIH]|nr:hypothetical protein [Moorena sp. SIOASIH]
MYLKIPFYRKILVSCSLFPVPYSLFNTSADYPLAITKKNINYEH